MRDDIKNCLVLTIGHGICFEVSILAAAPDRHRQGGIIRLRHPQCPPAYHFLENFSNIALDLQQSNFLQDYL
ncbi:hypothetical protein [Methylobacterium brachythecii]|uniref:Uncharacterized protein n=1 Tax=Methylobacterium brachythecii TaxID=1176177 RepID=A0A7W6ALI9_9HYPH|nr:hypothetical protein [Methylobacterium brachythecii]MBB3904811.1 hypothetical protein [Methylobacterium brachythecii]